MNGNNPEEETIGKAEHELRLIRYKDTLKRMALHDHAQLRRLRKDPETTDEELGMQEIIVSNHVKLAVQAVRAERRFIREVEALSDD